MNINTPHTTASAEQLKAGLWLLTGHPPRTDSMGACNNEGGAAVRMTCAISHLCSGSRCHREDATCLAALCENRKLGPRRDLEGRSGHGTSFLSLRRMNYAAGIPTPATICEVARMAGSTASLRLTILSRPTLGLTEGPRIGRCDVAS